MKLVNAVTTDYCRIIRAVLPWLKMAAGNHDQFPESILIVYR